MLKLPGPTTTALCAKSVFETIQQSDEQPVTILSCNCSTSTGFSQVLVDRHADSLGIPLGIDASVEQQVVLTVLGQSLPMLDPSLVLTGVETGSPLSRHGVAPGDVIVALNGARFRDLQHFGAQVIVLRLVINCLWLVVSGKS